MTNSRQLVLSRPALGDLAGISAHSRQRWGRERGRLYLAQIRDRIRSLQLLPFTGVEREDIVKSVRVLAAAQHQIIYRVEPKQVIVLRILHQRMDPARHDIDGNSRPEQD